jgi:sarcosine oxidase
VRAGREHEYVVVGLGGIGSAAAYWLSTRAGPSVLGVERFDVGHGNGASEDHSRIIRRSYHTPRYVRLTAHAYGAWREVEAEAGEPLIVRTGGIDLFPAGSAIPLDDYTGSMSACAVAFEAMDGAEAMRRWPQWRLEESVKVLYQPDAGIAAASRCNAVHRRLAVARGAVLRSRTRVVGLRELGGEVEVTFHDGRTVRCRVVVLAVDAWTNELLAPLGVRLPLTITQEQVVYLAAPDPAAFALERFPIWIWMDDPSFYGFPSFGDPGPKVAQDVGGKAVTADGRTFDADEDALRRVLVFVRRRLPGAEGPVRALKTCLYTLTPDRDFVLDAVPGHPNVLVALGAAHGFKFASLFGRVLADLAVEGRTDVDVDGFEMDRKLLSMEDPPTSFLI